MLGIQRLVGIQYRAAFTLRLAHLPTVLRWMDGAALLLAVIMLIAPVAYHRIAGAEGNAERGVLSYAMRMTIPPPRA